MRKTDFEELLESVRQMKAIQAGTMAPGRVHRREDILAAFIPDAARIRKSLKLSQTRFAALLGISVDTLQNWEQGRRKPEGPARVLLRVAATHPEALLSVARPTPKKRRGRSVA